MANRKYTILLIMNLLLIVLDQLTKFIVISNFRQNQSLAVINNYFNLTLVHNPGAAFGILASLPDGLREPFFLVVPLLTLLAILSVYVRLKDTQVLSMYSLAMIVGGAIGNIVDRVRLGYVIDFLDFHWLDVYHFPAFNIADSAITVGVGILMLSLAFEKEPV